MKTAMRRHKARAFVWFTISLAVLLSVGMSLLFFQQREMLRSQMTSHMDREIGLLAAAIINELQNHDYAAIEESVSVFGEAHHEIVGIRIVAPDAAALASYTRPDTTAYPEKQVKQIIDGGRNIATLELVHDFAPIKNHVTRLAWQLVWASLIFAAVTATVLWKVVRKTAFTPLETALADLDTAREQLELRVAERTADWMLSNKELKEEIEERLATEEALRLSESKYRRVIENINEIIYQVVIEDESEMVRVNLEFVSDQVLNIAGYEAEAFLRNPDLWYGIIHPDDLTGITASVRRMIAERKGETRTYRVRHGKTAEYIWLEDRIVLQFDEQGRIIGHFGVARDISRQKIAEEEREKLISDLRNALEAVAASRQEWRETFDSIMVPIAIMDGNRAILKANRAFSTLCGKRPAEIIGEDCLELLLATETPPEDNPVSLSLRSFTQVEDEIIEPRTKRVYQVTVFPFSISEKDLPGAIMVMKDMTDEREKEMRLIMSERLASLGQMASGIAHEINNPLAAIAGCVDGMTRRISREQYDPELFRRYLKIIKDEITRSKNITTSMLSVVRKSSYEKKQVLLQNIIDQTLEIIGYQGRLRRMEVTKELPPEMPAVCGSEGELRQVLLIIITNALDAMYDSGALTITAGFDEQNFTIDISDTGPGLPQENLTRIFDPFFTTKTDRGGTGLGLSIAQRIVAAQGGTMSVHLTGPTGTTFRISLPRSPN